MMLIIVIGLFPAMGSDCWLISGRVLHPVRCLGRACVACFRADSCKSIVSILDFWRATWRCIRVYSFLLLIIDLWDEKLTGLSSSIDLCIFLPASLYSSTVQHFNLVPLLDSFHALF